ncbi:PREDICTED: transcription factor bHLH93-like [Ipomoea nil]|uniref:transcription factor bHLH93-like n=1 Tax=Ipomoea nil TaxID=35883 RepID=UPI000901D1A6|nr:PREDICTED: transcription factor bHLH93-like [Ipomoea nil]
MELSPPGLYSLEELVGAPRRENWSTTTLFTSPDTFFSNAWSNGFDESLDPPDFVSSSSSSLLDLLTLPQEPTTFACPDLQIQHGCGFANAAPPPQEEYGGGGGGGGVFGGINNLQESDEFSGLMRSCGCAQVKMEQLGNNGGGGKKSKSKKVEGQPSKNLMAERRRRKRLNDRLSMLRSIVPKISKMDRTSILGDTIDYMKELLEKIHQLREDTLEEDDKNHIKSLAPNTSRELKSNEAIVRNPPKFDVERRNVDTRIEICCATKPGLLLSTVSTIEALGLDIHQCVISCFNDFSFQATCAEATDHRTVLSQEDVKQALFKTAGYGGRCL